MVNKQEIPEWLTELKRGRVLPFTRSEDFFYDLHEVFDLIQQQIQADRSMYSQDWVSVGLAGLAQGCLRKASRLFDLFVMDMPGKDKPEDELRDNMMQGIYAYMYHKMLTEGPRKDRDTYLIEEEEPPIYTTKVVDPGTRPTLGTPTPVVPEPIIETVSQREETSETTLADFETRVGPEIEPEVDLDYPIEVEESDSQEALEIPVEKGSTFLETPSEDRSDTIDETLGTDTETEESSNDDNDEDDEPKPKKILGYI